MLTKVRLKNMSTQSFRILIMGAAGAGSSTLGKALAQKYQLPHFDSDEYYWLPTDPPFTNKRSPEDRVKLLSNDLNKHDDWIVSGVLCNWGNFIIPHLTHVIFLYADSPTRLNRIKKRETKQFGSRILKGGDMYEHHEAFIEWASQYDSNNLISRTKNKHLDWLAALPLHIQVIKLDATLETDALIKIALIDLDIK